MKLLGLIYLFAATRSPSGGGQAPAEQFRVPYHLNDTRHIMIRAKLNGHGPYNFILDTGAPALYVPAPLANRLGVTRGADGWGTFDRVEVEGGAAVRAMRARIEEPMQIRSMNEMGIAGTRIDGVIGYDLIARFRIHIDLSQPVMLWTRLDYQPPAPPNLEELLAGKTLTRPKAAAEFEGMAKAATALMPKRVALPVSGRGFFGIELEESPGEVRVKTVLPGSPAEQAGLKPGDRILQVTAPGAAAVGVGAAASVTKAVAGVTQGETVRFILARATQRIVAAVRAGKAGF